MARRSSRGSVYNKRSEERIRAAQTSSSNGGMNIVLPQAHAQSAPNPTQNRQPQPNVHPSQRQQESSDPWARASQFASNVGRGAKDTAKSYTTDFYDMGEAALTGRQREDRSYQDETLAGVFGRGLFEGNLHGAWGEAGRRVTQEPGRVVGEVAAETAIMIGSMGFGAVLKGAKIGATGIKATQGGVKSWQSRTGFGGANFFDTGKATLRGGTQIKTVDKGVTTIKSRRGNNKWKKKTKKTGLLDRLELAGTSVGEKQGAWTARNFPRIANKFKVGRGGVGEGTDIPMVSGGTSKLPDMGLGNDFDVLSKGNIGAANISKNIVKPDGNSNISGDTLVSATPPGGGGSGTGPLSGGFTKKTVDLGPTYPMRTDGADGDLAYMGSNTIAPMIREQEGMGRMFSKKLKDEADYTQPSGSSTDRKILDGETGVETQEEWITHYQDIIGSNRGIKQSTEIAKTAQEKGVGSMDALSYSTDVFDISTKVKGKPPRTHSASIPIDVQAAQVQAETLIRSGFIKGQSANDLKVQLDNLVGGYAFEDATIVKTNVQTNPKGAPIPENIGLGTDLQQFGLDKNNEVKGAIPSRIGEIFEEVPLKTFKDYGYRKGWEPVTQKGLIATGKELKSGGSKAKTGQKRLWEIEGEEGGSTELDFNKLSDDDLQTSGISIAPIDEQSFLVATQNDPVKMVGGELVGNPQLGVSDQANKKATEKALDAILGSKGGSGDGYWDGKRRPHFGYDGFRVKYNLGQLPVQKNVKPTKPLPPKLSTFLTRSNLTYKNYYDLNFQTKSRGKDASQLKKYIQGDVVKEEYTGDVYQDSLFTKPNFMAAGSGTRKGDLLPQQNLVEEIKIVSRNRISPIRKPVVKRSSTPYTPKTIIEKDENLVAFDIKRVRELVGMHGTTAVKRRVSKPRRAVSNRGRKPKPDKVTSFTDIGQLGGDFGIIPETGNPNPLTRNPFYTPPSWYKF